LPNDNGSAAWLQGAVTGNLIAKKNERLRSTHGGTALSSKAHPEAAVRLAIRSLHAPQSATPDFGDRTLHPAATRWWTGVRQLDKLIPRHHHTATPPHRHTASSFATIVKDASLTDDLKSAPWALAQLG